MARQAEIKSLTGLRGVAAGFVVLYHFVALHGGVAGNVLRHGYLAVDLFFVLSGFVMAMTYAGQFVGGYSPARHGRFLFLRVGRVWPLYIVTTVACVLLAWAGLIEGVEVTGLKIVSNLFMVQAWGLALSLNGPAWSISTEFFAYVLFPALCFLVLRGGWVRAWLAVAVGAAVVLALSLQSSAVLQQVSDGTAYRSGPLDIYMGFTIFPLLRCVPEFAMGLLTWRAFGSARLRAVFGSAAVQWALLLAVAVLLAVPGSDVAEVLLFGPLILSLAVETSRTAALFSARPIYWLGTISYSLYLVHDVLRSASSFLVEAISKDVPFAFSIVGVGLLVPALLLSAASYQYVEKPARMWSRRALRRSERPGEALPEPRQTALEQPRA